MAKTSILPDISSYYPADMSLTTPPTKSDKAPQRSSSDVILPTDVEDDTWGTNPQGYSFYWNYDVIYDNRWRTIVSATAAVNNTKYWTKIMRDSTMERAFREAFDTPPRMTPEQIQVFSNCTIFSVSNRGQATNTRGDWAYYKYNAPIYSQGVLHNIDFQPLQYKLSTVSAMSQRLVKLANVKIVVTATIPQTQFATYQHFAQMLTKIGRAHV